MTIAEHLQQIDADPDAWLNREDVRGKVWEMLGKTQWDHFYANHGAHLGSICERCQRLEQAVGETDCPVPPPLDEPAEVVAERLTRSISESNYGHLIQAIGQLRILSGSRRPTVLGWFVFEARPSERALACLVAGGKVEE